MKSTYKIMADTWVYGHVIHSFKEQMCYLFMPKGKWWKFEGGVMKIAPMAQYQDSFTVIELKPYKKYECCGGFSFKAKEAQL